MPEGRRQTPDARRQWKADGGSHGFRLADAFDFRLASGVQGKEATMVTILLVESDQAALRALRHLLEIAGYRVCAAAREEDARRIAREETCRLAVVDLSAPGVAGIAICRSLCESDGTAVLALSAGTVPGERAAALAAGAREYLVKPVPAQRLLQSLAALMKKKPTSPDEADAG